MGRRIEVAADLGEVASARHLELPVQGPRGANMLVFISGVTNRGFDTDVDFQSRETENVDIFIDTEYRLRETDMLIDSSAYACLASIQADDWTSGSGFSPSFQLSLDESSVIQRTSLVIALKLSGNSGGDTALHVAYQANLLLFRSS